MSSTRDQKRRYRARHIAAGLCTKCPRHATRGRMCDYHAEQNAAYTRRANARRIAQGVCISCPESAVEIHRCAKHAAMWRLYFQTFLEERRACGICVTCGRRVKGRTQCVPCYERRKEARRQRRARAAA